MENYLEKKRKQLAPGLNEDQADHFYRGFNACYKEISAQGWMPPEKVQALVDGLENISMNNSCKKPCAACENGVIAREALVKFRGSP